MRAGACPTGERALILGPTIASDVSPQTSWVQLAEARWSPGETYGQGPGPYVASAPPGWGGAGLVGCPPSAGVGFASVCSSGTGPVAGLSRGGRQAPVGPPC